MADKDFKRYKVGGATRYLHESSGLSLSNATYFKLKKKYGDDIPLSEIEEAQKPPDPRFFGKNANRFTRAQRVNQPVKEKKFITSDENIDAVEDEPVTLNVPEPKLKSASGRPSGNSANTKELEAAFKVNMIIVTSIASLLTGIPEIEMTEAEAAGISIPAANLFEKTEFNKRFGRLIAGSGDYSLLGYAIYLYVHRVSIAINSRGGIFNGRSRQSDKSKVQSNGHSAANGNGVAADIQQRTGALLPYNARIAGSRGFATPS